MQINPLKEQRNLSKKYIIGYYSSNENFANSIATKLQDTSIDFEFIDLSSLDTDTLALYSTVLDEILIDSYKPENLQNLLSNKPFIRSINSDIQSQLSSDIDVENLESANFDTLSNSIKSRAKLIINLKKLQTSEKEKTLKFIMQLTSILEDKDPYTRDHSARVAKYSLAIAEKYFPIFYDKKYSQVQNLNLEQYEQRKKEFVTKQLNQTMLVAWAHDIGKNSIAINLLNKSSKLTASEYDIMKMHADFGADMIRKILGDEELAEAIENHHERIDGNGYHMRDEFSDIAKIIAIADSFDAMTTTRPYTTKLEDDNTKNKLKTLPEAINELQVSSHLHLDVFQNKMSHQLDTEMTDLFVKILKKELELIKAGNLSETTLFSNGLDENGYIKAGYWDDKTQLYTKDISVSNYEPKFLK